MGQSDLGGDDDAGQPYPTEGGGAAQGAEETAGPTGGQELLGTGRGAGATEFLVTAGPGALWGGPLT
ncbi:hypothetical protein OG806_39125 [Streptomyces sp. NBC_00882]|uniref:hypothetical protein n=1 Tax=Streptomyces sp. NBC_00882 TaxID=2975856 RepID=UPI00386CE2BB|nr:hypothetical protein OG806_39125 [Streptomyces sp. NBC_00882]